MFEKELDKAVEYIRNADALLITAGAGMGVDSGLPDYRGNTGFWKAYPGLAKQGKTFEQAANPTNFSEAPKTAWGFYGHRLNLYRNTEPHIGFQQLKSIGQTMKNGYFIFTSNVDGQFQKAGYPESKINEYHGSIHYLQCNEMYSESGCNEIWSAEQFVVKTDDEQCLLVSELPKCPYCNGVARPNILMFGDASWLPYRNLKQRDHYEDFISQSKNLVIIEIGAGTTIPSVRMEGEFRSGALIRINPREPDTGKEESVSLPMNGLEAIQAIYDRLFEEETIEVTSETKKVPNQNSVIETFSLEQWKENDQDAFKKAIKLRLNCRDYPKESFPFDVDLHFDALWHLIQDARQAYRIYEFYQIQRPGDIWKYCFVELLNVNDRIYSRYESSAYEKDFTGEPLKTKKWPDNLIPLNVFDKFFYWCWDDTLPEDECWLRERESQSFIDIADFCFSLIKQEQTVLGAFSDSLIVHELSKIQNKKHQYDYLDSSPYGLTTPDYQSWVKPTYSESYYRILTDLAMRPDIRVVAYRYPIDYQTVRILATAQRQKANLKNIKLKEALDINICDDSNESLNAWDANIVWWSEGLGGSGQGDLFIEQVNNAGAPVEALVNNKVTSRYILTLSDLGEFENYQRETRDDWCLYTRNN